jgi:hypothetical protein
MLSIQLKLFVVEKIKEEQAAKNKRLRYAEEHRTPIVGMQFLHAVQRGSGNVKKLIKESDMTADWLYVSYSRRVYVKFNWENIFYLKDMDFSDDDKYGPWGRNYW